MKGAELRLSTTWIVGEQLNAGGFGRVFELVGDGEPVVAKFVPKAPGADRELLFVNLTPVRNVVPIVDSGEFQDYWVLVMPKAEKSLREHLESCGGAITVEDATGVLVDVAEALADLRSSVVHRDLKPENVLLFHGSWCLADFGISRYAEASTSPDTHKWAMSPPYAAPERWRAERASSATDVYALGVMGYEMIKGHRPFPGPGIEDFREQHLHAAVPVLDGVPVALATVLDECLFKAPAARPSPENLLTRLQRQRTSLKRGGLADLQAVNQAEVRRRLVADCEASAAVSAAELREQRVAAAKSTYERLASTMRDVITDVAPAVTLRQGLNTGHARRLGWSMQLGEATLTFDDCTSRPVSWGGWQAPAFELDAWGGISVRLARSKHGYEGRAHSLWYGDIQNEGDFAWHETAFMFAPLIRQRSSVDPFQLDPGESSAKALWNGMAEIQVAWPFTRLEPENLDEFVERWASWFAAAAQGKLSHPSQMPERSAQDSWRKSPPPG